MFVYYIKVLDRHTTQQLNKFIDNQQWYKQKICCIYIFIYMVTSHNITSSLQHLILSNSSVTTSPPTLINKLICLVACDFEEDFCEAL